MKGYGLIFAADGRVEEASVEQAAGAWGKAPLIWIHLDGRDAEAVAWLDRCDLPATARAALTAIETRPRVEVIREGALLNLRGLAVDPELADDGLVSIRLWAEKGRVLSLGYVPLAAVEPVLTQARAGRLRDPGDLITAFAVAITDMLDPEVAALGDCLDDIEGKLSAEGGLAMRREIGRARGQAITFRRFVVPQREALDRLATLEGDWLEEEDRSHIRSAADRFARMAEELEAVRERAALMHEQLTDLRAEQIDGRTLLLSIVALVFLPLTFVTGLFGMNVADIPLAHTAGAFWWISAGCVAIAGAVAGYFIRAHWFTG